MVRICCLVLVLAVLAIGCAKPPEEQIGAAKAAVESARKAEADKYAPAEFKALQKSLGDALDLVDQKDYAEAQTKLEGVVSEAGRVEALAKANKEKRRGEAQTKLDAVKAAVARAKESLDKAPTGKGSQLDIEAMKNDLAKLAASLPEMARAASQGDFAKAVNMAESTLKGVAQIEADVQEAVEKQQQRRSKAR